MDFKTMKDDAIKQGAEHIDSLERWLNDGYLSLAEVARIPASSDVTITTGGLGSFPSDMAEFDRLKLKTINGVAVDKGDQVLHPINEDEIDDEAGTPTRYYETGGQFGLYPKSSYTVVATVYYYKYPAKMVDPDDEPAAQIKERFHDGIVEYALFKDARAEKNYKEAREHLATHGAIKEELRLTRKRETGRPRTVKARLYY